MENLIVQQHVMANNIHLTMELEQVLMYAGSLQMSNVMIMGVLEVAKMIAHYLTILNVSTQEHLLQILPPNQYALQHVIMMELLILLKIAIELNILILLDKGKFVE